MEVTVSRSSTGQVSVILRFGNGGGFAVRLGTALHLGDIFAARLRIGRLIGHVHNIMHNVASRPQPCRAMHCDDAATVEIDRTQPGRDARVRPRARRLETL